jgi:hypothetical protein
MKRFFAIILLAGVNLHTGHVFAQKPGSKTSQQAQAASSPVAGNGTPGQVAKWTGVNGENTFSIGNSIITETKVGLIGIGTENPSSKLCVVGTIESLNGGFKFPDGSVQTTAGLSSIFRDGTLIGNGTAGSPLGIAPGGVGTLQLANNSVTGQKIANGNVVRSFNGLFDNIQLTAGSNITITPSGNTLTIAATNALSEVVHDATLAGNGTSASPLKLAVPLSLTGSVADSGAVLSVSNTARMFDPGTDSIRWAAKLSHGRRGRGCDWRKGNNTGGTATASNTGSFTGGDGVSAEGGSAVNGGLAGAGVSAVGGSNTNARGGAGVLAIGGSTLNDKGGEGVLAIAGDSPNGIGGDAIVAVAGAGGAGNNGFAGSFFVDVEVSGNFNVIGGSKNFKIDHPLDPANQYLYHAAIESSEVLNIYSGNVTTDSNGEAAISLPDWFESINSDLRYQLTVVGQFAQAIVAGEVNNNRFTIKTSAPNVKVSWQVTGVRSDVAMKKHPFKVVEAKAEGERGHYLVPEAFDQPEEKSVQSARYPELMKQIKERRELRLKQQNPDR